MFITSIRNIKTFVYNFHHFVKVDSIIVMYLQQFTYLICVKPT